MPASACTSASARTSATVARTRLEADRSREGPADHEGRPFASSLYESEPLGDAQDLVSSTASSSSRPSIAADPLLKNAEGDRRSDGAQAREGQTLGLADHRSGHPARRSGRHREAHAQGTPSRDAQAAASSCCRSPSSAPHVHSSRSSGSRSRRCWRRCGLETGDAPAARLSAAGAQRSCARARPSRRAPRTRRARAAAASGGRWLAAAPPLLRAARARPVESTRR